MGTLRDPDVGRPIAAPLERCAELLGVDLATVQEHGVYEVGVEIEPGTYKTPGGADCYYARLRSDDTSDIITNNSSTGPQTLRVRTSDKFIDFGGGCE